MNKKIKINLYKLMAVPALVLFTVFFLYPLINGIGISMTKYNGISAAEFVGFDNFIRFFSDDRAINAMNNSLIFGIISAFLLNIFGLVYALILEGNTRFNRVARTVIYIPSVISPLITGYIWKLILAANTGSLHRTLQFLHLDVLWENNLADMDKALWVIISVNLLMAVGSPMIIYLAGIQSIEPELYGAAKVDGANWCQRLTKVTLPLLLPSVKINVITNIVYSIAVFDIIMSLTNGGPGYATESLSIFIYRNVYGGKTGYATAVAVMMFLIILVPVSVSLYITNKKEKRYEK